MHYYQFNIKDYRASTAHLTDAEDLAYRRLIDFYYDTEKPIPLETQWVSRRLRLGLEVVESVLNDFFFRTENGWINERCDTEIKNYQRNSTKNRENGKKGGRPKALQDKEENPVGCQVDSQTKPNANPNERQPLTINQEPLTIKEFNDATHHYVHEQHETFKNQKIPNCPFEEVVETYHRLLPLNAKVIALNESRKTNIRQRWREICMDGKFKDKQSAIIFLEKYFTKVGNSKFLTGRAKTASDRKPFVASLEWLMNSTNFLKVLEGKYDE